MKEKKEYSLDEIKKMNLYEKLSNITNEIERVRKNLDVGTGTSKYKAVAEKDVLDAVKDIEYKYRVYSYPKERKLVDNQLLKKVVYDKNGDSKEVTTFYSKIETIYAFINIDKPDEAIQTTVFSEGIDTSDKGSGKGMTYADKYALLKAYKIETGEDPDSEPSPQENEEKQITLKEAKEMIVNFGKYKDKNRTYFDVYNTDKNWLEYVSSGDNPNQIAKKCLELFDNMPLSKLKKMLDENTISTDSLLKKLNKNSIDELSDEEIDKAILFLENYIKQKENHFLTNSMLEDAENKVKER